MAFPLSQFSTRQETLLRALWADEVHIPIISRMLSTDLVDGETPVDRNAVTIWRRRFGLPSRRPPRGAGRIFTRGVEVNIPPMGKLPDPELVARVFGACRFEDAKVPAARGRISRVEHGFGLGASSLARFEGIGS